MRAFLLSLAALCAARAADLPRPDDPRPFTPADRLAMTRLVRRAAERGERAQFDPATMPAKLTRSTGLPVFVSAHRVGEDPMIAVSVDGTLFEQLQRAALELAGRGGSLKGARFKIDLVDHISAVPPPFGLGGGGLPVLGIHGLHVRAGERELWLLPTEALRRDLRDGEAFLRHALERGEVPPGGGGDATVRRFTTVSFIERPGGEGAPVTLYRGMPLVHRVTPRRLRVSARAAADYLCRMQMPDRRFHYVYDAAKDRASDEGYSLVRHAGTAWSLAEAAAWADDERLVRAARRAVTWLVGRAETRAGMAWLEYEDERPVGAAALGVLALLELPGGAEEREHLLRRLGRFLVAMQRPDGGFSSEYDAEAGRGSIPEGHVPLYVPGQATFALARLCRALPDPAWRKAAVKGAEWLATRRDDWNAARGLEYVHPDSWTILAVDELHAQGLARRAHVDYAFFLAHRIIAEQETSRTARWRDHVGAPKETPPRSGPAAARCEGLVAAWRMARRMGADPTPYRQAALLSARFQLAHQFDAVNGYLLPNPARAAGGFFSSYADHRVRMDTVQHNLSSLLSVERLLAAEDPPTMKE
jgi:hypothetical protein